MADFTTGAIFATSGKNSHFPVPKQMVKVQFSLDVFGKITCFTREIQAIVNGSFSPLVKQIAIFSVVAQYTILQNGKR